MEFIDPNEEVERARRRGARIMAAQQGKEIPFPESAAMDHAMEDADDQMVLAAIRGRRELQRFKRRLEPHRANEADGVNEMQGIGLAVHPRRA